MVTIKSEGVTPTERLLSDLCERSFLKLWSYPNPFKDDRDELCDLLAVFENHPGGGPTKTTQHNSRQLLEMLGRGDGNRPVLGLRTLILRQKLALQEKVSH